MNRRYFTLVIGVILITYFSLTFSIPLAENKSLAFSVPIARKENIDLDYRLPDDIRPDHYNIILRPYLLESDKTKRFTFDGEVFINVTVVKTTNKIVLHSKKLEFSKREYCEDVGMRTCYDLNPAEPDNKTDIVTYNLERPLQVDAVYTLHFIYNGSMDNDMHGFYRSSYIDSKNETKWLGTTQFQTNHARRAFPSFDEPKFKATFKVTITRHRSMKSVSNTNLVKTVTEGDQYYTDEYEVTPKMSCYLLAFIVSEFNERSNGNFGVLARPEYYMQTEYSFDVGQEILNVLDEYFKLPFYTTGINKMQMAAIPDFSAGAMENWGLLTYRERLLLYTEEATTLHVKQQIAAVVAHEQAHQWFGNLVTCSWWSYAWLNEGFARYFQYFATDKVEEEFELDKQFVTEQIQTVMVKDSMNDTNPMSDENTNTPSDLNRMFNSISYNKGAAFIRSVKHIMGEKKFQKSLQDYLKKYKYENTVPKDLFEIWKTHMENETLAIADNFFSDFTTQVGYPVVTFNMTSPNQLEISQERFLLKDNDGSDPKLRYVVPITFTTDSEKDFNNTQPKFFIEPSQVNKIVRFPNNVSWIMANIQVTGYYRVNYDEKTWHKIHHALFEENWSDIPDVNRAQVVDDLFNLARSGTISYDLALDVLEYLETETDYLPWFAALNGYSFLAVRLGTDTSNFASYFRHLSDRAYRKLGIEQQQDDTTLDVYNREQILNWSCKYGNKECIEKIKTYFDKDLTSNPVPINIRAIVYCVAMREANENDFDKLFKKYQLETVATEKTLILNSLGCVKDKSLVTKYFDIIISDEIRRQDKSSALASLYNENNENVEVVFDLIDAKLDQFVDAMGDYSAAANSISGVASRFTEKSQEQKLRDFNTQHKTEFGDAASTLDTAEKIVAENLEWAENKLSTFKSYLENRAKSSSTRNAVNTVIVYLIAVLTVATLIKM
uniref:Aminopeptidase n=1 Tax=Glossina brevipalpis TaxID=37001 RepID=A0A1A9W2N5_9MUSC